MWLVMVEGSPDSVFNTEGEATVRMEEIQTETKEDLPGDNEWDIWIQKVASKEYKNDSG